MSETTTINVETDSGPNFTIHTDHDIEGMYDEMLDDVFGVTSIAGYEYDTSRALKEVDPIAYRTGFNDYCDRFAEMEIPSDLYLGNGADEVDEDAVNEWIAANLP